ncbi:hypothetical protein ABW20_dc0100237 [Dactylellina cionopaga]|nr:hypothetical protein ABW20_dc0100237 [Dactylellina cionopaga]
MSTTQYNHTTGPVREEQYEDIHVHQVYDTIASHFSATRYKPWPIVEQFLRNLPPGAVGVDIGCGNGKYLNVNPNVFVVGSDRCESLVKIAKEHAVGQDVTTADILFPPYKQFTFDFALSIAVIHHLSSPARRIQAISSVLDLLRPTGEGKGLLYVWALEQKTSRRGWDKDSEQDVLVPWVLSKKYTEPLITRGSELREKTVDSPERDNGSALLRYYHLYREGELEEDVKSAGGKVLTTGYERDNWWAIVERAK